MRLFNFVMHRYYSQSEFFSCDLNSVNLSYMCFVKSGQFSEDMIPTVGFNMRKVTKGNVTIKVSQ